MPTKKYNYVMLIFISMQNSKNQSNVDISIIRNLIKNGKKLTSQEQQLIFSQKDAKELLLTYLQKYKLCLEAEIALVSSANAKELLKVYCDFCPLYEEAEVEMVLRQNANELLDIYEEKYELGNEASVIAMHL